MYRSYLLFQQNIDESKRLSALYEYTSTHLASMNFDDILRSQIVYCISALDKFIHDLIRIGMLEIFAGTRTPTARYLAEGISIDSHNKITLATIPPKEYYFELEIVRKQRIVAYQDPNKIAEGLSLIWNEPHKWQAIASRIGIDPSTARTTLKTISDQRNRIVHEADMDIVTGYKYPITLSDTRAATTFISDCGRAVYDLVKI